MCIRSRVIGNQDSVDVSCTVFTDSSWACHDYVKKIEIILYN